MTTQTVQQRCPERYAFIVEARSVLVYGMKRDGKGFANHVVEQYKLARPDVQFTAVHPEATELDGLNVLRSAKQTSSTFDSAIIAVKPASARQAIADAASAGIKRVWLVFNAARDGNLAYARQLGLEVSEGCPLLFMEGVGTFHGFHRSLAKLFGRV